jgi:APA family basic amino acid/polyamine antiporter
MMKERSGQLSLFALIMIAIGATIASGIFKTPAAIASKIQDNQTILWLWVLGGTVSLIGALVFSEMGSRFSNAGGVYTYLNKAFGSLPGFLYGWCLLTVISSGTIAALCTVFAENMLIITGADPSLKVFIAALSIVVLTLFNTFGLQFSEWFANIGTVLKMIGIYALMLALLILGKEIVNPQDSLVPVFHEKDDLAGALVKVLWTFTGWHYASFVAGDAQNPKRNIPLAMLIGTSIVTLTYVFINIGYFKVFPHDTIAQFSVSGQEKITAVEALNAVIPGSRIWISILIALSVFAGAGLYILSTPRIFNQMALEGLFFKAFAKKHPRFGVPVNAILLQSGWAIFLVVLWGTFESIIDYVTFIEWLFLLLACIGIFFIRFRYKDDQPAFRVPLYPVLPLIFIGIVGWFIVMNVFAERVEYYAGLAVIPIGVLMYFFAFGGGKNKVDLPDPEN